MLVAVPGAAAAAAGPRARALAGDAAPADGEVRREGAVEGRGHDHRDQRPQDRQAGADDGHVGLEGQPQLRLEEAHCAMASRVSDLFLGATARVSARVGRSGKEELTGEVEVPFAAFYQLEVVMHPDAARGGDGGAQEEQAGQGEPLASWEVLCCLELATEYPKAHCFCLKLPVREAAANQTLSILSRKVVKEVRIVVKVLHMLRTIVGTLLTS